MGITDAFTKFSNAQALDGEADATVVSDNSYELSTSTGYLRDLGAGEPVRVRFYVDVGVTGATSVAFNIILSSASNLGSNVLLLASSGAVVVADLTLGSSFDVLMPSVPLTLGDAALRRYLGVSYTIVGTVTVGSITASIVTDSVAPRRRAFVTGYTGP